MPQRLFGASPDEKRVPAKPPSHPEDPGDELRSVIRLDWVVYILVAVIAVLSLATLFGTDADRVIVIVGTLVTFATGIIGGVLTYLRRNRSATKHRGGDDE